MEEELEIILRAIDEASDVFGSVSDSASEMGESVSSAAEGSAESFNDVESSADSVSDAVGGIDGSNLDEVASGAEEVSSSSDTAGESLGEVASILGGIAGVEAFEGIADSLMQMADAAGTFNDSMMRAGLEAEGAGLSVDDMKGTVNDLSEATGRAGGQIREAFIKATARGVTDMDSFKTMMEGAGAQATLFGTDIESMGNKFSSMAQKDTLMTRALAETGITMDELATAMGMTGATADEVKDKWKELDTNQRAAILGTAASMNEGQDANEAYKNSWAGLNEKLNVAWGRLERLAGEVLLPVLVPAIEIASRVLSSLGDVISAVMSGPLGGLVSIIGSVAAAFALAVPAYMAVSAALTFLTGPALAAAAALWAAVAPLLPFIAIGAAIVLVIYEIGKAFGWWTDASSMIDAIGAGLQRLWNAFINHPDVQAAISAISGALSTLWDWIQQAGQAVLEFFGISSEGNFDIVRALIDGIGAAWEAIKTPIELVISVFTAAGEAGNATADAFGAFWNGTLVPFGEWLSGVFAPVWSLIGDLINAISPFVTNLSNAFSSFANGQMSLPSLIWTVLTTLFNAYVTIFSMIISRVASWGMSILSRGISAATNFVMGIITRISQLPNQVMMQLRKVIAIIREVIQSWITAAVGKVSSLVSQVVSKLSGLPNDIASAVGGVVDAIVKPFQDAYDRVCKEVDKIKDKAAETVSIAAGGESSLAAGGDSPAAAGGDIAPNNVVSVDNSPITVENNINLTLDLRNVPSHISTEQLGSILNDKGFIRELVNNRDFQLLDSQAKERLNLKINRARGI